MPDEKERTKISNLPVPEKELDDQEKEKIKGGTDPFSRPKPQPPRPSDPFGVPRDS